MKMTVLLAVALAMAVVAPVIGQFNPITGLPPPPMAAKINVTDGAPIVNMFPGTKMMDPPMSPYINTTYACPKGYSNTSYAVDTVVMSQNDFIPQKASPFSWDHLVFKTLYKLPPFAEVQYSECRGPPDRQVCTDAYIIDVKFVMLDLGCPVGPTPMITYNGSYPGPTMYPVAGRQSMIRVTNKLYEGAMIGDFQAMAPCNGDNNRGIGSSLHHHGGSTLAPYDGWADDITCPGQTKDYIFADEEPAFLWYHDHTIAFTTYMTYYGLAGLWVVDASASRGGCGYPWGIEGIPTLYFAFTDRTYKSDCTNYFNYGDAFILGDVNEVNGLAWPAVETPAQWTKIMYLNAANERVWILRVVDEYGVDQSSKRCKVIGSDAGLGRMPQPYPPTGVFMSPGERYEVMCNFEGMEGQVLYMWNEYDHYRSDNQCFFCYTHLTAKITLTKAAKNPPQFKFDGPRSTRVDGHLPKKAIKASLEMKEKGECTRVFNFSHDPVTFVWYINDETWDSFRVGAPNVGQNTWELWCLNTEVHIHHPIHVHLVNGYIVSRNNSVNLVEPYEVYMPKDVFVMYPNFETSVLIRFGPMVGEWMFHCHITKHEDDVMMRSLIIHQNNASAANEESAFGSSKVLSKTNADMVALGLNDPESRHPVNIGNALPFLAGLQSKIEERPYRIFYPDPWFDAPKLLDPSRNPWLHRCAKNEVVPLTNRNIMAANFGFMHAATHSTWGTNCLDSEFEEIEAGSTCETPLHLGCPLGWNNNYPCDNR